MVFMYGSLDAYSGPPTPFALRMRPWLVGSFTALGVVGLARLVTFDVTGSFFLMLAVLMGYMAIRKGMNIAWLLCLAMILFLNSMLDLFLVLAAGVRTHWSWLAGKQPWPMLVAHVLVMLGPIVELTAAWLCWDVYKEHLSNISSSEAFLLDAESVHSQVSNYNSAEVSRRPSDSQQRGFSAFTGTGHKLAI
eukprot:TRINITY_DN8151_c0_g1_i2.p1 TRINITY_DN8151_c0_g1~~TRINITY_DN8151_c0_g1_i2.p1  ORF type:complete len:192 (-),score=30.48 TRINITY_DN8151_c0_g1_i2:48-623(-)